MGLPGLTCEKCGRLDATVRFVEFFDSAHGVWCETHARIEKRLADFYDTPDPVAHPITPRQSWREDPLVNGQLLTEVAFELHRRGETAEAEKAEASAARFTAEARGGTSLPGL
jgi:hypothetical protein